MKTFKKYIYKVTLDKSLLILIGLFPIFLIIGNLFINLFIFFFSLIFLVNFKRNIKLLKDKIFYILLLFFISLLLNVFFSLDPLNSIPRVAKLIFIVFFIFEIKRLLNNNPNYHLAFIYKLWFLIFIIIIFDIFFELLFGNNILGFKSELSGRIASFFGEELVAGAYLHGFSLFFLSYMVSKKYNNYLLSFSIILVVVASFLIGERANFIRLFISVILFSLLVLDIEYKKKIISLFLVVLSIVVIINFKYEYKVRYVSQIKILFTENGFSNYMKQSQYGAHQNAAIKIFNEYPYFGVGVKNYRNESIKEKYENLEYSLTHARQSSHPHQIHHEFLSETGIVGYVSFLLFIVTSLWLSIKNYFHNKNIYQLSSIIYIISSLIPFIPTGSFLSTFYSGIFWINYAIMISYINKSKF